MRGKWNWGSLFVFVGALFAAGDLSAQIDINPIEPGCIAEEDETSTFIARVTADYDFDLNLKVYLNGDLVHNSTTAVSTSGPSVRFSKTLDCSEWGQLDGDYVDYVARATLTAGPNTGSWDEGEINIDPVEPPGGCGFLPNPGRLLPDRDRQYGLREEKRGLLA